MLIGDCPSLRFSSDIFPTLLARICEERFFRASFFKFLNFGWDFDLIPTFPEIENLKRLKSVVSEQN